MNTRNLTTLNLDPFLRSTIGGHRMFENMMGQAQRYNNDSYPPYNIVALGENKYRIEIAVAGFAKEDITVKIDDGQLTIASNRVDRDETKTKTEESYLHHGISSRRFERQFALADHIEVRNATVENGILKVSLERIVPENLKPKEIKIT